jgi:aspartate/methionine/tyrosine aminotransferase
MQGSFINFLVCGKLFPEKDTILFLDPGFPVQKQQIMVLGYKYASFDVYHYRGEKLRDKMISILEEGNIAAIIYSNPNNPSWICFHENELQTIGELATRYDAVVLEDLAYFAMDFRRDLSRPFQPPYQASVGRYTDNYVLLISSSKAFSYAGQRVGLMCISDKLYDRYYPNLKKQLGIGQYGQALIGRVLYSVSSGTSHSAQYALARVFESAASGTYNFLEEVKEYGRRAKEMKRLFLENNFQIVYATDMGEPIADGFYFTLSYPGMSGDELLRELLYFGISAITLSNTGSSMEGIRACVSQTGMDRMPELAERLKLFSARHRI